MDLYVKALPKKKVRRPLVASYAFLFLGCMILLWVGWPIISFAIVSEHFFAKTVSPIASKANDAPVVLGTYTGQPATELTNANLWFPTRPQKKTVSRINAYRLSIPKLKIADAAVIIGSDDLNKSLIHYGGTAVPGAYGTGVVFGHSILPQFYDPKNYRSIFSLLPTLKKGDAIIVTYDSVQYIYHVYALEVTAPDDLSVLEQHYDDAYLTLVTCVPPGTYLQRLHVKARLSN